MTHFCLTDDSSDFLSENRISVLHMNHFGHLNFLRPQVHSGLLGSEWCKFITLWTVTKKVCDNVQVPASFLSSCDFTLQCTNTRYFVFVLEVENNRNAYLAIMSPAARVYARNSV